MSSSDRPWRLRVQLPRGYEDANELFVWLRDFLLPAVVHAPVRVTLHLVPPDESDRPIVEDDEET